MTTDKTAYRPALLIGAGGTGVKILRYIQSLAAEEIDAPLQRMLDCKYIRMVAMDTDDKSNDRFEDIDPNMVNHSCDGENGHERLPEQLHTLDETWLLLNREPLNRAVATLHRHPSFEFLDDCEMPLKTIGQWFPPKLKTGDGITLGHSKISGASQWRPLGRLAFFLNAATIYQALAKAIKDVQQADPSRAEIDVYIACSLAGGTGSGLFWDLAFMVQMIAPGARTSGLFLLGDPFEAVDEAGRIFPNIYAALKEIVYFKNWEKPLEVVYPINDGKSFDSTRDGHLPFDIVYLFQSFPPGFGVVDRAKATIDYTCFRMAQNLLSHMRTDVHKSLDVGANNIDSDASAMASQGKKRFCFSTSASVSFPMHHINDVTPHFVRLLVKHHQEKIKDGIENFQEEASGEILETLPQLEYGDWRDDLGKKHQGQVPWARNLVSQIERVIRKIRENPAINPYIVIREYAGPELRDILTSLDREKITLKGSWQELADQSQAEVARLEKAWLEELETIAEIPEYPSESWLETLDNWLDTLEPGEVRTPPEEQDLMIFLPPQKDMFLYGLEAEGISLYEEETSTTKKHGKDNGKFTVILEEAYHAQYRKHCLAFLEGLLENFSGLRHEKDENYERALEQTWRHLLETLAMRGRELHVRARRQREEQNNAKSRLVQFDHELESFISEEGVGQKEIDFQLFLEQMMVPSSKDRRQWYIERARTILKKLAQTLGHNFKDRNEVPELGINVETMAEQLERLSREMSRLSGSGTVKLSETPFFDFLNELVGEPEQGDASRDEDKDESPDQFLERMHTTVSSVVDHWSAYANNIMMQSGGEDAFLQRLHRCRPTIFADGNRENPINKKHLVIFPFTNDMEELEKKEFNNLFKRYSQKVFKVIPGIEDQRTENPLIYYEDLFRSAEEIARIQEYFRAYNEHGSRKRFFHIHPKVAEFEEIICEQRPWFVSCGNPGCNQNIKEMDREDQFCKKCRKPIWNRCGNKDCKEDSLKKILEDINCDKECGGKYYVPHSCPSCKQDLKNWWWTCSVPSHKRPNPMDKISCVTCVEDYHRGDRRHGAIVRRQDRREFQCDGCKRQKSDCCPVDVPHDLRAYYEHGVNGHDSTKFFEKIESYKNLDVPIQPFQCEKGVIRHMIFPTCPEDLDTPGKRHHLYKANDGRWACTDHSKLEFRECGVCNYPISSKHDNDYCPRCTSYVKECFYCSETTNQMQPPLEGTEPKRCSFCKNFMESLDSIFLLPDVTTSLEEPAFCPNIFNCKAAAHPHDTATEHDLEKCRVCDEAIVLPRRHFEYELKRCPVCTILFHSVGRSGIRKEEKEPGQVIIETINRWKSDEKYSDTFIQQCSVCGICPVDFIAWVFDAHMDDKWKDFHSGKEMPRDPWLKKNHEEIKEAADTFKGFVHQFYEEYCLNDKSASEQHRDSSKKPVANGSISDDELSEDGSTSGSNGNVDPQHQVALEYFRSERIPRAYCFSSFKILEALVQERDDKRAARLISIKMAPIERVDVEEIEELLKLFNPKYSVYKIVRRRITGLLRELNEINEDMSRWSGPMTPLKKERIKRRQHAEEEQVNTDERGPGFINPENNDDKPGSKT